MTMARAAGGNLRIARPQSATLLRLRLSKLQGMLHPYPTIEEAQAGL
jgi:hypothetical protein